MRHRRIPTPFSILGTLLGAALVGLLTLPLIALVASSSLQDIATGAAHPMFAPALWLSLRTTVVSLVLTVATGTPLAWWLASTSSRSARIVEAIVDLPVVMPPAVVGIALLRTFGRNGILGPTLDGFGVTIPFTHQAVIIAQLVVASPFFVQATTSAFRRIDPNLLIVARSLGASPTTAFVRVALPLALPGLAAGACLAWARALGEFGATLLFAGNMTARTQTMPLAIFTALESDVRLAVVFSLVLAGVGALLLLLLRGLLGHAQTWRTATSA